jgi:Na+-transporting methylmalonyl-CoA/oxaloacetate decarboxylase gamma subunit
MTKWDFGLTMTLVGMGGTLFSLWILTLVMALMKRLFPAPPPAQPARGSDSA